MKVMNDDVLYLIFSVQVFPLSYLILYLKGAIHQAREEWDGAKSCYQNALSIYPRHLQSLQVNIGLSLDNTDHVTCNTGLLLDHSDKVT